MKKQDIDFVKIPVQVPGQSVKEAFGLAVFNSRSELIEFEGVFENGETLYYRPGLQKWHQKNDDASFMITDKIITTLTQSRWDQTRVPKKFKDALGL